MEQENFKSGAMRPIFRKLAGVLEVLIFFVGLPATVYVALDGHWDLCLVAFSNLLMGIGFAGAAITGRMFCFRKSSNPKGV